MWNISRAQVEIRKKQGMPERKNIYVPHGIFTKRVHPQPLEKINRHSFVISANLSKAFHYGLIIDAFKNVVGKVSKARLIIIGTGESAKEISRYIRANSLEAHVSMLGWMPHDKLIDFISHCGVGLAVYTSQCSWTNFSDSFKAKEYLGCGCPVIISGATAAIEEIKASRAVIVADQDEDSLCAAMLKFLEDEHFYVSCRENAINFMKDLDWQRIYSRGLSFLHYN